MRIALDTTHRRRVLFVDLQEVESLDRVEQVVNAAAKCPHNPILALGQIDEWDAMQARPWPGGVMYDPVGSWVSVEILDAATGQPIPGYGKADCQRILTDAVRIPVTWRKHRTLAGVKVDRIKLRFRLYGRARLYSFAFQALNEAK